jgi:hypothetical protein
MEGSIKPAVPPYVGIFLPMPILEKYMGFWGREVSVFLIKKGKPGTGDSCL